MKRRYILCPMLCVLVLCLFGTHKAFVYRPKTTITHLPVFTSILTDLESLPTSVNLHVSPILQLPELPNGCEGTSLTMVLNYFGLDANKVDVAQNYIKCEELLFDELDATVVYGQDPNIAFIGDPSQTSYAFYCFSPPVVNAANEYLEYCGLSPTAEDVSGSTETMLLNYLSAGQPVIIWATLNFSEPYYCDFAWTTPDDGYYIAYANLHCYVLTGYDSEYFYLCDPLLGRVCVPRLEFMLRYTQLGSNAVILNLPSINSPFLT